MDKLQKFQYMQLNDLILKNRRDVYFSYVIPLLCILLLWYNFAMYGFAIYTSAMYGSAMV